MVLSKVKNFKKLKVWVDIDGDGQTDKGELQELSKHGITEIVIPGKGKMESTSTREVEKKVPVEGGVFEEDFYRANYQDVNQAIVAGKFKTGYEHYLKHGMLEGRYSQFTGSANEFNEKNYLLVYVDVRELVKKMGNTVVVPTIIGPKASMKNAKRTPIQTRQQVVQERCQQVFFQQEDKGVGGAPVVQGPKPDSAAQPNGKFEIPDPNFSSKLGGEIILRTDLNYVVRDLARYGEINKLTHDEHQKANDAQVDEIIGGVKKGTIPLVKKGKKTKADYEREQAKEGVLQKLHGKNLPVEVQDLDVDRLKINLQTQYSYKTESNIEKELTLDPPKVGNEIKKPKAKIKLHTQIKSDLFDMRKYAALFQRLKRVHKEANTQQIDEIGQGISAGKIPFKQGKVELNNKDILKSLFMKVAKKSVPREAKPNTVDIKHVVVNVTFDQLTVTEQKIWEVFFDHKDKNSNKGHRSILLS